MKKFIKWTILILVFCSLIYGGKYAFDALPIISGYGAKNLCSCVYVSGRSADDGIREDLGMFPLSLGTYSINSSDSSATGSVFGIAVRKAIFRNGVGCTLVSKIDEEELRQQKFSVPNKPLLSDTLPWPYGSGEDLYQDSLVNYSSLQKAIDNAFLEDKEKLKKNTRAVLVVHNGNLIAEKYADGFTESTPQIAWSMTKSFTNALIGILVKEGKIDIYKPAPVKQWSDLNDPRHPITIDNLLRMSSGLYWEEEYAGPSTATKMLFQKADMGGYAASQPVAYPPDSVWYYSSGTSNILSKVIRETVGEKQYVPFVYNNLLYKIGMSSAVIEPDPSGTYVGSSYMYATPRDLAKFGYLFLNDGVWNGERILPEGWVKYSSTPTAKAAQGNYGAHFWLNAGTASDPKDRYYPDAPADMYSLNGFNGQRVFIIPSKNVIIVRMGLSKRQAFDFNLFVKEILASIS